MSAENEEIVLQLNELIQNNRITSATEHVKGLHPMDVADILEQLEPSQSWRVLERLPNRAEVFTYFETEQQLRLATELPRLSLAKLVSEMPADERTDLFKRFSRGFRESLLQALALDERDDLRTLAAHMERKSTRLNSSHVRISYAVFCLKKKR